MHIQTKTILNSQLHRVERGAMYPSCCPSNQDIYLFRIKAKVDSRYRMLLPRQKELQVHLMRIFNNYPHILNQLLLKYPQYHNFPSGPVFKPLQCRECGFNPWLAVKVANALGVWPKKTKHNIWKVAGLHWTIIVSWSFQLWGLVLFICNTSGPPASVIIP